MPFRPSTEWVIAGSSEHPPAIADRRAHHFDPAVGGLPVRARTRERRCAVRRKHALEASADTIAHALVRGAAAGVSRCGRHASRSRPRDGDLYVFPLHSPAAARRLPRGLGCRRRIPGAADARAAPRRGCRPAYTERYLIRLPRGRRPALRSPSLADVHAGHGTASTVWISRSSGRTDRARPISSRPSAPGPDRGANHRSKATTASSASAAEPRIQAFWLQTAHGYHLEARMPLSLVGLAPLDRGAATARARRSGFKRCRIRRAAAGCSWRPRDSTQLLGDIHPAGTRATVVDANALKLGIAGQPCMPASGGEDG